MKYIVLLLLLAGGGYYYYINNYVPKQQESLIPALMSQVNREPVDLFEFKQALAKHMYSVCRSYKEKLEGENLKVSDCMEETDRKREGCYTKVFRLAPVKLETREEMVKYGNRYMECALPYSYMKFIPLS